MIPFIYIALAYVFMEFVAHFSHKYVMHGFLWVLHKDHHVKNKDGDTLFQKNDFFFLIYALPAMALILSGITFGHPSFIAIGIGITLYGFTYFLIHDVVIHGRFINLRLPHWRYFDALLNAHHAHHHSKSRRDFVSFGLLLFPVRFWGNGRKYEG